MHTLMLMIGLLACFAHANGCEQNYVRVEHVLGTTEDPAAAYNSMTAMVDEFINLNVLCNESFDTPRFDAEDTCWYPYPDRMVCGFRLWRQIKGCDIVSVLNSNLYKYTFTYGYSWWQVYDQQQSGNVNC
jgi:hypothetical protein